MRIDVKMVDVMMIDMMMMIDLMMMMIYVVVILSNERGMFVFYVVLYRDSIQSRALGFLLMYARIY